MKKILFPAFLVTSIFFTACNGADEAYTPAPGTQAAPVTLTADSAKQLVMPAPQNPMLNPAASPGPNNVIQNSTTTTTAAKGMNPAHGLPGHRCDIAVGAPLSSPAPNQSTITPPPTNNNIITTVAPPVNNSPNKVVTAPGMNPPHGEAGHRCEIAVGAPLNSAPVQNNVQPVKKDSGTR